jgi:hypothetical protein
MSEFPRFAEGTTVRLTADYDAVAIEYTEDGEQVEHEVEITDPKATFEIVSTDYDGGFVYNLRLDGEVDEYDYIRVFGVDESDIERL